MRAEFAIAVDPIFDFALQTIAEIDRGSDIVPATVHVQLLNLFDRADALQGTGRQWQLAKYAMAAWIDEMMLNTPWAGASWWREHILEMELFQTRLCSVRFFQLAQLASADASRDALEVYVNCVQLGFRGVLAQSDSGSPSGSTPGGDGLALPRTIDDWLRQMEPRLDGQRLRNRAPVAAQYPQRIIEGAPPLPAKQTMVWWSLAVVVLLLINGWIFQSNAIQIVTGK